MERVSSSKTSVNIYLTSRRKSQKTHRGGKQICVILGSNLAHDTDVLMSLSWECRDPPMHWSASSIWVNNLLIQSVLASLVIRTRSLIRKIPNKIENIRTKMQTKNAGEKSWQTPNSKDSVRTRKYGFNIPFSKKISFLGGRAGNNNKNDHVQNCVAPPVPLVTFFGTVKDSAAGVWESSERVISWTKPVNENVWCYLSSIIPMSGK